MTQQATDINNHLALYVWEGDDVLGDYTSGIACVLASSEKEAWELLKSCDETAEQWLSGQRYKTKRINPKRITKPEAFVCWGRMCLH